jgi:hypothetical protein
MRRSAVFVLTSATATAMTAMTFVSIVFIISQTGTPSRR